MELKESVCFFTRDFNAPFDNNQVLCEFSHNRWREVSPSHVKTKTKVMDCFRTKDGVIDYIVISYVGTAQKHVTKNFHCDAILSVVSGDPAYQL